MSLDTKPKNLGSGLVASLDPDGGYVQLRTTNNGLLLTPHQAVQLRDYLIQLLKEWRNE